MHFEARRSSSLPYILRVVRARPRLIAVGILGCAVAAVAPADWPLPTRMLVAWDIAIALYLILAYVLMGRAHIGEIRERAAREDEGRVAILVLTVTAALASLGAIILELESGISPEASPAQLVLALVTILLSWAFTHTIFALHYAHEYYSEDGGRGGGLVFAGDDEPDYWDFVYFAFVIGMTSQVSDVVISCKPIRRTVAAHGVLSFIFNTALLALTINIAAGALQGGQN